jgi:AcrR family transcriptional regulator
MGTRERQGREREAVRRAILNAARELFVSEGYRNVSMRKIAERIEYSPAAIYGYFENKDDIFFALAEEGFRLLSAPPIDNTLPPLDAVRSVLRHFYQFSKTHPEYFDLMFVDRSVPRISRDWERFAFVRERKQQCVDLIQRCVGEGIFPRASDAVAIFRILTSAVFGVATFRLADRLPPNEDPDALAHDAVEAVLAGLRAGVTVTFSGSTACSLGDTHAESSDAAHASPAVERDLR